MRLAKFIETEHDAILAAAVTYGRTIHALRDTPQSEVRNHLPQLLETISSDLRSSQSRTASIEKAEGRVPEGPTSTPAQTHGRLRAALGISIEQLVAEFRALRSSVLRIWSEKHAFDASAIDDITRFNEAIDQAVAESIKCYEEERERWRQIFLGVLGHDLRGPLNSIGLTVELMRRADPPSPEHTALLSRAVKRLTALLDSLLEYNKAAFGTGMQLQHTPVDLRLACADELELLRAAHPEAAIELDANGDARAHADASRVREALSNLVTNAVKHGTRGTPVTVRVGGDASAVRIAVENAGNIPADEIEQLFQPLRQRDTTSSHAERSHLGLGLFIARQIARAHGGEIRGRCHDGLVKFTIELPKSVTPPSAD